MTQELKPRAPKQPVVNQWRPNPDCEQCKHFERIVESHIAGWKRLFHDAMKKVKTLSKEVEELKRAGEEE